MIGKMDNHDEASILRQKCQELQAEVDRLKLGIVAYEEERKLYLGALQIAGTAIAKALDGHKAEAKPVTAAEPAEKPEEKPEPS